MKKKKNTGNLTRAGSFESRKENYSGRWRRAENVEATKLDRRGGAVE